MSLEPILFIFLGLILLCEIFLEYVIFLPCYLEIWRYEGLKGKTKLGWLEFLKLLTFFSIKFFLSSFSNL